jgi:hypothetical protein
MEPCEWARGGAIRVRSRSSLRIVKDGSIGEQDSATAHDVSWIRRKVVDLCEQVEQGKGEGVGET